MSNLRTPAQNREWGGPDNADLDCYYPVPSKTKTVEAPSVAEEGPGDVHPPLDTEKRTGISPVEPWWAQQDLDLLWIESQQEGFEDETDSGDPQEFK